MTRSPYISNHRRHGRWTKAAGRWTTTDGLYKDSSSSRAASSTLSKAKEKVKVASTVVTRIASHENAQSHRDQREKGKGRQMTELAMVVVRQVIWPGAVLIPRKAKVKEKRRDRTSQEKALGDVPGHSSQMA